MWDKLFVNFEIIEKSVGKIKFVEKKNFSK